MTTDQRRRSAATLAQIEEQARHTTQVALATPAIDPQLLSELLRRDKLAAAALLATLSERQRVVQALACTTWLNELLGFDAGEGLQAEQMIARFEQIVAIYTESRVEASPVVPYRPLLASERPTVNLFAGRLELDDRTLQAAYELARMQRDLLPSRWQRALERGYRHLCDEAAIGVRADGAYFWWGNEGGSYTPTPAACQCEAFTNSNPCKHRGAAIILSFYAEADDSFNRAAA